VTRAALSTFPERDGRVVDDPSLRFQGERFGDLAYASIADHREDIEDLLDEISDEIARLERGG
jgi:hypothetical protein